MKVDLNDLFWNASIEEITDGYIYDSRTKSYICLICGSKYEKGIIYQDDNLFFEAEKFLERHIEQKHGSVFNYLINMNKKYTGLTDLQTELIKHFYLGTSDKEIVNSFGGGSTATIRNHRFKLKEREKQAKVFLAIMNLLNEENIAEGDRVINFHKGATMVDDRFNITEKEREKVIHTYFDVESGRLNRFPSKEKRKVVVLQHIIKSFELNRTYTEKEVNEIIKYVYDDFVTIRRYFIEYGFMERAKDGSAYWVKV